MKLAYKLFLPAMAIPVRQNWPAMAVPWLTWPVSVGRQNATETLLIELTLINPRWYSLVALH